jgi:transposase
MTRWVHLASEWLKPIYRQIKDQMMKGSYLQVDETPIRYLDSGMESQGGVICGWRIDRVKMCSLSGIRRERRSVWRKLIPLDFSGTIQCDGYSAYDHFAKQRASAGRPVLLAGCWAHARRYFYEALDHAPKEAGWILIQIGHLYEIERRLHHQEAGPARDAYCTSQSTPICRRIHRVLQRWFLTRHFLPKSTMDKLSAMSSANRNPWRFTSKNPKSRSTIIS